MQNTLMGEFIPVIPEIFLAAMAMILLIASVFNSSGKSSFVSKTAVLVFALTAVLYSQLWNGDYTAMNEMFSSDGFTVFVKIIILFAASCCLLMSLSPRGHGDGSRRG